VLDGIGYGRDASFWGGEFLLADYIDFERLGMFKPVALLGAAQAMRHPWRNTLAHIRAAMGWAEYQRAFARLELTTFLLEKPLETLERLESRSPRASSCGRLFDAVAAAIGICRESVSYEGQAAAELEAVVDREVLAQDDPESSYPIAIQSRQEDGLPCLEPLPMWRALFADLALATPVPVMAARFHRGLADAVVRMVLQLTGIGADTGVVTDTVALTGGVFQNRCLLELVLPPLDLAGLHVLQHRHVPASDGGLSLGQAAVAAARRLSAASPTRRSAQRCA
jgi:hydrogenase maturation protein HypF